MGGLQLSVDGRELAAEWTDACPETRRELEAALPLSGTADRWGDELYFPVPVTVGPENAREVVPVGAVAYWPQGSALCLFWGRTPASQDDQPRAASPVNVVAVIDDVAPLVGLEGGATVRVDRE